MLIILVNLGLRFVLEVSLGDRTRSVPQFVCLWVAQRCARHIRRAPWPALLRLILYQAFCPMGLETNCPPWCKVAGSFKSGSGVRAWTAAL